MLLELPTMGILRPHARHPAPASFTDCASLPAIRQLIALPALGPLSPAVFQPQCLPLSSCHHVCSEDSHSFPRQPRLPSESLLVTPHGSPRGPSALHGPDGALELSPEAGQAVSTRTLLLPSSTSQTTVATPTPPSLPHPSPKSSDCTVPRPTSPSSHTITPHQGFSLPCLPFSMPTLLSAVPEREA